MDDSQQQHRRGWFRRRPPGGQPPIELPPALAQAGAERGWPVTRGDLEQHSDVAAAPATTEQARLIALVHQAPLRLTADYRPATIVHGHAGSWELVALDVVFTQTGRPPSRPQYAISAVPVPIPLPELRVSPRRFLHHRAGGLLVLPVGDPAFDARYQVLAAHDTPELRGIIGPALQAALLASRDLDEVWTAAGYLAASRVDGHHDALLNEHCTLLAAAMVGLQHAV